jgi:hypothetical protein
MKRLPFFLFVPCLVFSLLGCSFSGYFPSAIPLDVDSTAPSSPKPTPSVSLTVTETITPMILPSDTPTASLTPASTTPPAPDLLVAYGTSEGIYLARPSSTPALLTTDILPLQLFLPRDHSVVVYAADDPPGNGIPNLIGLISLAGGDSRVLLSASQLSSLENDAVSVDLAWIPNTHRMLFSTNSLDPANGLFPSNDLYSIDIDTGAVARIFTSGSGGQAAVSPDATKIAVSQCRKIFLASILGSVLFPEILSFDSYPEQCYGPSIVWKTDSSRFGTIVASGSSDVAVWLVDASTGEASASGVLSQFGQGMLSPTLEFVAYAHSGPYFEAHPGSYPATYDPELVKVDGSGMTQLSTGVGGIIAFAPDGNHVAFYTDSPPLSYGTCDFSLPRQKIYIGSPGGILIPVSGDNRSYLFQWINNSQFVYISGGYNLVLGDVEGHSTLITNSPDCITVFDAMDLDLSPVTADG